jgi:TPP-dependent pyruvate/acetoin dehydrogenase alpha subunit
LSDGMPEAIETEVSADVAPETLRAMHLSMLRIRKVEEKVAELVERGEIVCPCHLYIGQEAVAAGVCSALRKDDWVFSTHRSHGHYIAKGGNIRALMAEMHGRATGCSGGRGGSMHIASPDFGLPGSSAIVAGTISLAVGAALAFQLQGKDSVAVPFFGDGAANEGVFYECLNLAALKKLPVVFVCENNLYSTHLPVADCLADVDIYRKAEVCGMPGVRVDGNSAVEVHEAATKAVENARRGGGPALIECMTYRWRGHVGPNDDLDKGLRSEEELKHWMNRCPIKIAERQLLERGVLSESEVARIVDAVDAEVEEALAFARQSPYPDQSELTSNVFKM